jgi:hypothetical protein
MGVYSEIHTKPYYLCGLNVNGLKRKHYITV